jgi:biotin synthase
LKTLIRSDWTFAEVKNIYNKPLLDLVYKAASVHREFHSADEVQVCVLLSIKTGGCPEDCAYCPQAARYHTNVEVESLLPVDKVLQAAENAKNSGATRFCMGAAWRQVRDNKDFDRVLEMVKGINDLGLEVCSTLGMLTEDQAVKLKEAGLYAYNHNLDSGEEFYSKIITTRKYEDRLATLKNVRNAGLTICSGGIVGMGETDEDRMEMLHTLSTLPTHPESVPVNALVPVAGTPLENQPRVSIWTMIRMIATARILMPASMVRLSAGRTNMSDVEQAFCFMAGANSIFAGDKLLTTPNPDFDHDKELFSLLGLHGREAFKNESIAV